MFEEAIKVGKLLSASRLIDGASGNMSFKLANSIYITRSGVSLDDITESSFVKIRPGEFVKEASVDQLIHLKIYEKTDYNAVLHCHGVFNVVLGSRMDKIEPLDLEGKLTLERLRLSKVSLALQSLLRKFQMWLEERESRLSEITEFMLLEVI